MSEPLTRLARVVASSSRWRLAALGLGVAALAVGLGALVPLRLPDPALANRVLARPHRIAVGQDTESAHLLRRIERLGYRRTRSATPNIGEYTRANARIAIHRREFTGPEGPVPPQLFELDLGWGDRVEAIVD